MNYKYFKSEGDDNTFFAKDKEGGIYRFNQFSPNYWEKIVLERNFFWYKKILNNEKEGFKMMSISKEQLPYFKVPQIYPDILRNEDLYSYYQDLEIEGIFYAIDEKCANVYIYRDPRDPKFQLEKQFAGHWEKITDSEFESICRLRNNYSDYEAMKTCPKYEAELEVIGIPAVDEKKLVECKINRFIPSSATPIIYLYFKGTENKNDRFFYAEDEYRNVYYFENYGETPRIWIKPIEKTKIREIKDKIRFNSRPISNSELENFNIPALKLNLISNKVLNLELKMNYKYFKSKKGESLFYAKDNDGGLYYFEKFPWIHNKTWKKVAWERDKVRIEYNIYEKAEPSPISEYEIGKFEIPLISPASLDEQMPYQYKQDREKNWIFYAKDEAKNIYIYRDKALFNSNGFNFEKLQIPVEKWHIVRDLNFYNYLNSKIYGVLYKADYRSKKEMEKLNIPLIDAEQVAEFSIKNFINSSQNTPISEPQLESFGIPIVKTSAFETQPRYRYFGDGYQWNYCAEDENGYFYVYQDPHNEEGKKHFKPSVPAGKWYLIKEGYFFADRERYRGLAEGEFEQKGIPFIDEKEIIEFKGDFKSFPFHDPEKLEKSEPIKVKLKKFIGQKVERLILVVHPSSNTIEIPFRVSLAIGLVLESDAQKIYIISANWNSVWFPQMHYKDLPEEILPWKKFHQRMKGLMNGSLFPIYQTEYYELTSETEFQDIVGRQIQKVEKASIKNENYESSGLSFKFENDYIISAPNLKENSIETKNFKPNKLMEIFAPFEEVTLSELD